MSADVITVYALGQGMVPLSRGKVVTSRRPVDIAQRELIEAPYLAENIAGCIERKLVVAVTSEGEELSPARMRALAKGVHAHTHDPVVGFDPLAADYSPPTTPATVQNTDIVGDLVVPIAGPGGTPSLVRASAIDQALMPAAGVIVSKSAATVATVQLSGPVVGVYAGMTPGPKASQLR